MLLYHCNLKFIISPVKSWYHQNLNSSNQSQNIDFKPQIDFDRIMLVIHGCPMLSPCTNTKPIAMEHPPFSIDWLKGKITGKSYISWENLWFPEGFPSSQPIDISFRGFLPGFPVGPRPVPSQSTCASAALRWCHALRRSLRKNERGRTKEGGQLRCL